METILLDAPADQHRPHRAGGRERCANLCFAARHRNAPAALHDRQHLGASAAWSAGPPLDVPRLSTHLKVVEAPEREHLNVTGTFKPPYDPFPLMATVEQHTSPDGFLQLIVDRADDGDWTVGFAGFGWHTHGDLLTQDYGGSPESAVRAFVDEITSSRRAILVFRVDGGVRDVWIDRDVWTEQDAEQLPANETLEKRFWG